MAHRSHTMNNKMHNVTSLNHWNQLSGTDTISGAFMGIGVYRLKQIPKTIQTSFVVNRISRWFTIIII